uniref:Uncharacterized protein n=1 Tax=Zea mays TaxID=4577 RepID=A0A804MYR7_MAIZE
MTTISVPHSVFSQQVHSIYLGYKILFDALISVYENQVAVSRRMSLFEDCSQLLFELLDASLNATTSPDCSVKMAYVLTNVSLTYMAKLRDERFICPAGTDYDVVTCLDIISSKQLTNAACNSLLFKLVMATLTNESSEILRRRQYALLLSYLQYCSSILDSDVPPSVLWFLLLEEQDGDDEDITLQKVLKEHNELAHANISIIRKEAQAIVDLMDTSSPATLVNAQMLNMFVGRRVRTVVQVQHNEGGVLVGQSTDGHQLCVKSAMDVPVSHFMEVYGIAENSETIRAEVCTDFGPNFGEISNAFGVCLDPLIAIV